MGEQDIAACALKKQTCNYTYLAITSMGSAYPGLKLMEFGFLE